MKRLLLEILCGMAVLVFLASLHGRVSSLKESRKEVTELRTMVRDAVHHIEARGEQDSVRIHVLEKLESKISALEKQIAQAAFQSEEACRLREQLGATQREAALFKAELKRDITRTQQTVDAYQAEMRSAHVAGKRMVNRAQEAIALLAERLYQNPRTLTEELLTPAVQLNGDDTVGSGTLIHSGRNPKTKQFETYVITSYHVVRNILADTPRAKRDGIAVTIYRNDKKEELKCDVVSHDTRIDAALLKLRSTKRFTNLARVISKEDSNDIQVWDRVYAVGCPLGNDPIPSQGEVSSLHNELNGANYWMINAPTYFGNSGGGVFLADTRELAGVFSKIYTHGRGNPVVIPHMGLFTPMPLIRRWLEKENLSFVLDNSTVPQRQTAVRVSDLVAPAPR